MTAHHRLYILDCGVLIEPDDNAGTVRIPVPAYVIRTASGRTILVDTGNPKSLIGARDCSPWYEAACEIAAEDDPLSRLAELGILPREVDAIITTHFDFDNAGRYDAFGPLGTDVFVQRAHIAAALADRDRYDEKLWRVPGLRWRLCDGDVEIEPGIRLLRTDGHAVGHQSIAVETATGWVILAVDAIDNARLIETRQFPDYFDAESTNRSIDKLIGLSSELDAAVIFGHDPEQWARLVLSPREFALN